MHVYASDVLIARYSLINDERENDGQERVWNDNELPVFGRRAAGFIFPPTRLIYRSGGSYDYPTFLPKKRYSFGRKQHWDAYFGRRR
jgi:hypothetical protein